MNTEHGDVICEKISRGVPHPTLPAGYTKINVSIYFRNKVSEIDGRLL